VLFLGSVETGIPDSLRSLYSAIIRCLPPDYIGILFVPLIQW
jgi:hypothetical protein